LQELYYISILGFALIGTPLFVIMAAFALTAFFLNGTDLSTVAIEMFRIASSPTLITIPLFTLAGYIIAESQSPNRIINLARALVGWIPNGIAVVCILVCAFFTAFTGASGVTIIALGGLISPILLNEGFSKQFSLGLITTCGSLGLLFAPSLPLIIYGLVAQIDIDKLFLAGMLPGLFLILVLAGYAAFQKRTLGKEQPAPASFSLSNLKSALWDARYEAPLPILVLLGIYGGLTTITETAAFTAGYAVLVSFVLNRDLKITADLPRIIISSMTLVGTILIILCCALGLTNYMIDEEVPMHLMEWMRNYIDSPYMFLLYLNVFLLVVGCLMDIFSAIIVVVPLILPIAKEFQIDPYHLAIVFLTNLEIGYITPPVGINLFISGLRFKKSLGEVFWACAPFMIILLAALLVITYVPILSTYLLAR
jgi:C4-dicarboxylate transporter, DctM subunit